MSKSIRSIRLRVLDRLQQRIEEAQKFAREQDRGVLQRYEHEVEARAFRTAWLDLADLFSGVSKR